MGMPKVTFPQGSAVLTGRYFITATATGSNMVTGIWLLGNGAFVVGFTKVSGFPFDWQPAPAIVLKSPFSMAAVGMWVMDCGGFERLRVLCQPPKKNSLSLMILPPKVPPNWFRFKLSWPVREKKLRAFKSPLRRYS